MKVWAKGAIAAGIVAALTASAVGYLSWAMAGFLMTPPPFDYHDDPARYHLSPEAVRIHSLSVSEPLSGWFFKHDDNHQLAVLFLHGWRSSKQHMLRDYVRWLAADYDVLSFDFSNHGESPKGLTTMGANELLDAHGAADWLKAQGYKQIAVLGTSMGGAVAIDLAAEEPAVRAVAIDGAFARPDDVATDYFAHHGYPLPGFLGGCVITALAWRTGADVEAAAAIRHVGGLGRRPLLVIHGEEDHVVPPEDASELFAAAQGAKQIWLVPGADHISELTRCPHALFPQEYEHRVKALFNLLLL